MISKACVVVGSEVAGMLLNPYFEDDNTPEHYKRTDTLYSTVKYDDFVKPRGIHNKEITGLLAFLPQDAVIAGSFVANLINPATKYGDIDIFFKSATAFMQTYDLLTKPPEDDSAWMYKGYKSDISKEDLIQKSPKVRTVNFKNEDPSRPNIQLIKMVWYETTEHVIDSFDFTVCQFSLCGDSLTYNPAAVYDLLKNSLVIHRHQFPLEALYRLVKYSKKGYNVSPRTLSKIATDIREAKDLNPSSPVMY